MPPILFFSFAKNSNNDLMKQAMRERVVWLWMLMGIAMAAMGQHTTRVSEPIKVMTYNVRHCAGMDLVVDYGRTAEVILRQQPDVVALQELDSMTGRSGQCDQLNELARRTGYIPVFGGAIDYDGGKYGDTVKHETHPLARRGTPHIVGSGAERLCDYLHPLGP